MPIFHFVLHNKTQHIIIALKGGLLNCIPRLMEQSYSSLGGADRPDENKTGQDVRQQGLAM